MKRKIGLIFITLLLLSACDLFGPLNGKPKLITNPITNISYRTATSGGIIISDRGELILARGICWGQENLPTVSNNYCISESTADTFICNITNLSPGTLYYVRSYATNHAGTGYGEQDTFSTIALALPRVTTENVLNITYSTATCTGRINSDEGSPIISRGVCWSVNHNPTIEDSTILYGHGTGGFECDIQGLEAGTNYWVRAFASNTVGTSYGNGIQFMTIAVETSTVTDIDGNVYQTVKIGDQWWMAENLKVTHYRNGTSITRPRASAGEWNSLMSGAFCAYDKNETYANTYGYLYNWKAVNTGGLAPSGWHVPSLDEWETLLDYLGGGRVAGGKLKEKGTDHWLSPNKGATNICGFNALPGGICHGGCFHLGESTKFWSSTRYEDSDSAYYMGLWDSSDGAGTGTFISRDGFSIRCVKDS